jgi:hypothetical protein
MSTPTTDARGRASAGKSGQTTLGGVEKPRFVPKAQPKRIIEDDEESSSIVPPAPPRQVDTFQLPCWLTTLPRFICVQRIQGKVARGRCAEAGRRSQGQTRRTAGWTRAGAEVETEMPGDEKDGAGQD